jgi:hypothetical protein
MLAEQVVDKHLDELRLLAQPTSHGWPPDPDESARRQRDSCGKGLAATQQASHAKEIVWSAQPDYCSFASGQKNGDGNVTLFDVEQFIRPIALLADCLASGVSLPHLSGELSSGHPHGIKSLPGVIINCQCSLFVR